MEKLLRVVFGVSKALNDFAGVALTFMVATTVIDVCFEPSGILPWSLRNRGSYLWSVGHRVCASSVFVEQKPYLYRYLSPQERADDENHHDFNPDHLHVAFWVHRLQSFFLLAMNFVLRQRLRKQFTYPSSGSRMGSAFVAFSSALSSSAIS